jgi:multidrug efflux pump subunit AcrB
MPDAASAERTFALLKRCQEILKGVEGVQDVLALSTNPFGRFDAPPCILIRLAPADGRRADRERIKEAIRDRFRREVQDAAVRLRDLSGPNGFPLGGAPVRLAVLDTQDNGLANLRQTAEQLAERLNQAPELRDAAADPASRARPQLSVVIDRDRAKALGVSTEDVYTELQVRRDGLQVGSLSRFGRSWPVTVQVKDPGGDEAKDLARVRVHGAEGEVALGAIAAVRSVSAPQAIDRLNMYPMVEIDADLAPGASPAEVRKRCEALANELLPKGYRIDWLQDAPGRR